MPYSKYTPKQKRLAAMYGNKKKMRIYKPKKA